MGQYAPYFRAGGRSYRGGILGEIILKFVRLASFLRALGRLGNEAF